MRFLGISFGVRQPGLVVSLGCFIASLAFICCGLHGQDAVDGALDAILKIERGGEGVAQASAAAEKLQKQKTGLESLLEKASTANPVAKNWILSLAQAAADRQPAAETNDSLVKILADRQADGEVRYWVLDRMAAGDKVAREKLLDGRTEDPSLDIRYEAIELAMSKLPSMDEANGDTKKKELCIASYEKLLQAARLPEQINAIAEKLKTLGTTVELRKHFGFISTWQVVGPFDNRQTVGFEQAYPPEIEYQRNAKLDQKQRYPGKNGEVGWQPASTEKADGEVDLNPIFTNEKGAVVYAYTVVQSPRDVQCEVRLGCINANKVWVNGTEATANNVYHTGAQIDQYTGVAKLKSGANTVLVKVCQNEQTDSWAQNFAFQLRFTDTTGRAIELAQ